MLTSRTGWLLRGSWPLPFASEPGGQGHSQLAAATQGPAAYLILQETKCELGASSVTGGWGELSQAGNPSRLLSEMETIKEGFFLICKHVYYLVMEAQVISGHQRASGAVAACEGSPRARTCSRPGGTLHGARERSDRPLHCGPTDGGALPGFLSFSAVLIILCQKLSSEDPLLSSSQ